MKFSFSKKELSDLVIATLALAIAFSILISKGINVDFLKNLPTLLIVMIFSFVIHELSHKYFAIKFKYKAEFRANFSMLILAIAMSFFQFIFAAPGAVMFAGEHNKKKIGIIALAGPASNIIIAIIAFILTIFTNNILFSVMYFVNATLGFFNMLPFPGFDGNKIIRWNKWVFFSVLIISLLIYNIPIILEMIA